MGLEISSFENRDLVGLGGQLWLGGRSSQEDCTGFLGFCAPIPGRDTTDLTANTALRIIIFFRTCVEYVGTWSGRVITSN